MTVTLPCRDLYKLSSQPTQVQWYFWSVVLSIWDPRYLEFFAAVEHILPEEVWELTVFNDEPLARLWNAQLVFQRQDHTMSKIVL